MNQNNISTLFGKYRCEDKEKLLAELNINQTDEEELKYTLNKNQELVSSLFFNNATEWKQDFGLMDAYKKAWPYCDMDFLKQQRDDYCFWENTSLSSKSNVTFFHPVKFIGLMEKIELYNPAAKLLFDIQNVVVHLNNLRPHKNSIGGVWGKQSGTFCNHAVYLTIRALDADYTKFTGGQSKIPDSITDLLDDTHKKDYQDGLWPSNVWCDILEYQSNPKNGTTIKEVNKEQAKKLANMGYVVIAAWKNTDQPYKGVCHPHFVTLAPYSFLPEIKGIPVAHIGETCRFCDLFTAFYNVPEEQIRYFYNEKQNFIFRKDFSDGYCKSLSDMIEKYKLWSNSNDIWKGRV